MKGYPVTVPGDSYRGRGKDPARARKRDNFNRVASLVEQHINSEMAAEPEDTIRVFLSHTIASAIGEDADLVQRVVFGIDAGGNGVTILKGNFDRAMARK